MNIPWDHIFQTAFSSLKLLLGWFSQLNQQVNTHLGMWGQLGLHLLVVLLGFWILYQLFVIIKFIMFRILLPLAIISLTLLFLVILTS
ncbi:MAG: hypothetical protein KAW02_03490 [candidate division Zixibacteria bacterium]|nr:hypothetical protein [candidate division Zixibacteria bacterium]